MDDKIFQKKFQKLQFGDDASYCMKSKNYQEAIKVIDNLFLLLSDEDVVSRVYFMVLQCECYLLLKDYLSVVKECKKITKFLTSAKVIPDDIFKMAETFQDKKFFSRAYIAFIAVCDLYVQKPNNDTASSIQKAFQHMQSMAEELGKSLGDEKVLKESMVDFMEKVAKKLKEMSEWNTNQETVEQQARCYHWITCLYEKLDDKEKIVEMSEVAIRLMVGKLDGDAQNYKILGDCYHHQALACYDLGKRSEYKKAINSAIQAKVKATDYPSEEEKKRSIAESRAQLPWY